LSIAEREEKVFSFLNFIAAALSARVRALFSGFRLFWLLLLLLECHRVGSLFEFQVGHPLCSAAFCFLLFVVFNLFWLFRFFFLPPPHSFLCGAIFSGLFSGGFLLCVAVRRCLSWNFLLSCYLRSKRRSSDWKQEEE
jgi:hypothetical protein